MQPEIKKSLRVSLVGCCACPRKPFAAERATIQDGGEEAGHQQVRHHQDVGRGAEESGAGGGPEATRLKPRPRVHTAPARRPGAEQGRALPLDNVGRGSGRRHRHLLVLQVSGSAGHSREEQPGPGVQSPCHRQGSLGTVNPRISLPL